MIIKKVLPIFCVLASCHGEQKNTKCNDYYINAKTAMSSFVQLKDTSFYSAALWNLDSAMRCTEIRKKAIAFKISILSMENDFIHGKNFIKSLKKEDFDLFYQKEMYNNLFLFAESGQSGMTADKEILTRSIKEIEPLLIKDNQINKPVFSDYLLLKSKIIVKDSFNYYLQSLKTQHPGNDPFFDQYIVLSN